MKNAVHWFERAVVGIGGMAGWLIMPLMLVILAEIVARSVFGYSFTGIHEVVEFLLVAYVALSLARAHRNGAQVAVTLLTERFSDRLAGRAWPGGRRPGRGHLAGGGVADASLRDADA